ncbi:hypothetical protein AcV5_005330 [Taiwanofungus camphoratus]|nr:hypothetical protein AcV5_005330 [Antrodia cinnamomea]
MVSQAAAIAKIAHGPCLAGIFMNVMYDSSHILNPLYGLNARSGQRLYGVMITQTFFYFTSYRSDPKWMRIYVGILFLADTLNSVFNMWWIYNALINNFGNVEALAKADWLFETEEGLTGIIGMLVQLFYAWRIHKLTRNVWLVGAVVTTSLVGGLAGIGTAIAVAMRPEFAKLQQLKAIVITWLVSAAVCDGLIALALSWHLRQNRTGFSRTDTIISRLVRLTMSNGLLTAGFALADVVAYLSTPTGLHIAFNYTLVKLYGNSVMSSLNSRAILLNPSSGKNTSSQKETMGRNTDFNNILSNRSRPAQLVVNVETHEMVDVAEPNLKTDPEWSSRSQASDTKADVVV